MPPPNRKILLNDFIELRGQSGQFFLFWVLSRLFWEGKNGRKNHLPSVILFVDFELNLVTYRLDLPPLPLPSPDQIAKEKPLQNWNQRHREYKKDGGEDSKIEQKAQRQIDVAERFL